MPSPIKPSWRVAAVALSLAVLLFTPREAVGQAVAEAYAGSPFGVGRVELDLPRDLLPEVLGPDGIRLSDKESRVFYPAIGQRAIRGLVRNVLDRPHKVTIHFLFQGDGPLDLVIESQVAQSLRVAPRISRRGHDGLLRAWWQDYASRPRLFDRDGDYPPILEEYLQSMLAARLGLRLPEKRSERSWQVEIEEQLGLAPESESLRAAFRRDRLLGRAVLNEPADRPLPEAISAGELLVPEPDPQVEVDPIAMRVPAECFYVRFGSFSNFLWFQDTLEQWGGDLQNLVAARSLDRRVRERIEDRLVLRQSVISRLLGDTVVADVAIIGTDFFFEQGGAFGFLFHARQNNMFLAADIARQRQERIQQEDGVIEEKLTLAGREVSLLASPDGTVRSYYVADGDFHFVTTSKALARQFIETASGTGALGNSKEFRYARTMMPADRNDTVFVYLSDAFLRNLLSPHYRVERLRRMQALADLELVELAALAAAAERKPCETMEQLIAGGFLPPGFGPRPDGSRAVLVEGEAYDSLRGRRGAFVPVPDVSINGVTRSETEVYRRFAEAYESKWGPPAPILVGIKRRALSGGRDRIVLDVRLDPLAPEHFERLRRFTGPADRVRLAPIPEDVVAVELLFPGYRLFGGLQDFRPPVAFDGLRLLLLGRVLDTFVGYVGTTGGLGFLSILDSRIEGPPDESGYAAGRAGLWRKRSDLFTVFSFQREVLDRVLPQLRLEETERPAQARLHVGDLSAGRFAAILNNLSYARTRETSLGNIRLMESLAQQLRVPGEACRQTAERLLDAELVCPLGGEYGYQQTPGGVGHWTSTALADGQAGRLLTRQAPEGYQAPPLNWFRGLELEVLLEPASLSARADIIMQKPEK